MLLCASTTTAQTGDLSAGIAHFNARRWSDAHVFFAAAVKAQPKNPDAALWYGRTLIAEDNPGDAQDWFEKAIDLEPRRSESHLWLARSLGMQAQRASVLKQPFIARHLKTTIDKAIDLDPDNIDARELRWQFYLMAPSVMGGGEEKARSEAAEILRRNRYRGQLLSLAEAGRGKDAAAAERALKAVVAEFPDSSSPAGSYASWLVGHNRVAEAFGVVEAYQKRRPADPIGWYLLGRTAANAGQQLDRGEDAMRRYLANVPPPAERIPTIASARAWLGGILKQKGDKEGARREFEAALKLDPHNGLAKRSLAALGK